MKKIINLLICLGLAACTSTHQGTKSLNVKGLALKTNPVELTVIPGEKISGTAECKSFLGITYQSPGREAYGADTDTTEGNFAMDKCTRGAFYDAIVSSNADVILSPQYRSTKHGVLCVPYIGCLYSHDIISVIGYKGTYQYSTPAQQYVAQMQDPVMQLQPMDTVSLPAGTQIQPIEMQSQTFSQPLYTQELPQSTGIQSLY